MIENKCVDCGIEISDSNKRRCDDCEKKLKKKKHLSNFQIISKYDNSKNHIKKLINRLGSGIDKELSKLSQLKCKFMMNQSNEKLLDSKMGQIVLFKDKLISAWNETMREDNSKEEDIDLNAFFKIK